MEDFIVQEEKLESVSVTNPETPNFLITLLVARLNSNHARLYSNYAHRLNFITERLRWRSRLQQDTKLHSPSKIKEHLALLKNQSLMLRDIKTTLEKEQTELIEQLNFLGYGLVKEHEKAF
jgi:hypothetical protein